ncbi:rho GTPase-activating protein 32 isoform X2 [Aythya fuligula]|nr:rho GTPase-activating protein 32 isoform X2 [Aythya fuligula]
MMKSSVHGEEDDFVPELQRSIHPRERPDWEETLSTMARGADIPDISGELPLRTCGSTASMKVKNVKKYINPGLMGCDAFHRLSFTKGHFPKMAECAHFHYENVDFGNIQLSLPEEQNEVTRNGCESKELVYLVQISCQGRSWIVKRSYEDFRVLDKHLHLCIYDRRFSQLSELPRSDVVKDNPELVSHILMAYVTRLSAIAGNKINCGPALTWMELDNKGNHLLIHEESPINIPAIAAAHVIKRYIAQAGDELSFEVGDIVSVIDMPPKELTTWWRGKHGFQVGFFPSECVELINDKVPQSVTSPNFGNSVPKPVSKKHGKLITFLRSFMKSRPTKHKLRQRGILKERVFGCDLGEHLLNSGHDVPQVLKSCTEFIEKYGIVDGIYRVSGVASNIQKLRHEFDSEQIPDLTKETYVHDIHSVSSLCKLYFRELPNPLLTYHLYDKFSDAVSAATDDERLVKIHDVIQQLPPPHYRTLEFLMRHLARLADYCSVTNMHAKNLAIVWAPNLLRSKQVESSCFNGTAAFMEVRIQSIVVEFILNNVDILFSSKFSSIIRDGAGHSSLSRPKSLLVSSPSTKLLTLKEAQARTQTQTNSPVVANSRYVEVEEGPAALQGKFHTVIDFPSERKRPPNKMKKSPVGSWRSFFNLGKSSSVSKRKLQRNPSEPSEMKATARAGGRGDSGTLRSAKSEESLTSLHAVDGETKLLRPRRPRSSSDALSASFNGELLGNMNRCNSYDNLPHQNSDGNEGIIRVPALISPRSSEDVDLSPPDIGVASLDFDPMSFQCSPPQAESECLETSTSLIESVDINKEKPSLLKKDVESGSQSHTPGSATSSEPVSPFQEKMNPTFTMDQSPTEEKACKPHVFSPKTEQKPIKSPPPTTSEPVSSALPSRMSEPTGGVTIMTRNSSASNWSKEIDLTEMTNKSPTEMSLPLESNETGAGEGAQQELQHAQPAAAGKPESPEEGERPMSSSQNKSVPTGNKQPGAVALDSPQDPVPVSSVSLIPPPPPKNAARMLALVLAESAQQASAQSQKKPGDTHSESTNYGETEAGTALEKLHVSAGAPDKLHLYTSLPENRLHFQPGAPVEKDFQGSSTAGKQNHLSGAPGARDAPPVRSGMPGDMPASRDEEQEQSSFHPRKSGDKDHFPSHAGDKEHHTPGALPDLEPPTPDMPVDKPQLRACMPGDKHLAPACTADDKLQTPPVVTAGEKSTLASVPYLTTIQTTATEPSHGPASQHATGPASTQTDSIVTATQRMLAAIQPAMSQRQDHQSAMGQVPAASAKATTGSSQVWGATAPEKLPDPAPVFASENSSTTRCSSSVPAGHQSHVEKPRESTRAPPLHLRSESVPTHSSYSFTPPVPPVRTLESKIAAAMHSNNTDAINNSNYHAFLASSMLASFVEEALLPPPAPPPPPPPKHASLQSIYVPHPKPESIPEPSGPDNYLHHKLTSSHTYRPESVPPHISYHTKPDQHQAYPPRSETPTSASTRYNTYTNQGKSTSTVHSKPRSRMEFVSSVSPMGLRNTSYGEDAPPYPTIRRVQSLHVPTPAAAAIRSVPISRTEVPPDDEPVYCTRPLYQYKPYQPHSDYHVTQLQPYFENGRVHYRYSPYSSSSGSSYYTTDDGNFYDLDPYNTVRAKPFHPMPSREFASCASRLQSKGLYRNPGLSAYPQGGFIGHLAGKEHSFISRDVPPAPDIKHTYMSWDLEDMEKYRMQSIRRESRTRQKMKGPVMSQYDNVTPLLPDDLGELDVIHLRSKSDPGKTGLLTVAEGKEGRYPAKAATPEGDERYYMQHTEPELDRAHYHGAYGNGPSEKPSLPQKQSSIRSRKLHEPGCSTNEHGTHFQQEGSHRQPSESKNGPPYCDYRPKGGPEPSEPISYQHSGGKYMTMNHDTLRLNHKEVKLADDRQDLERPRAKPTMSMEKQTRDNYKEEEHAASPIAPPPKPERSHSLRMQHPESMEKDSAFLYPYQTLGKRQSTMTVMSHYDNLEDYHTMPQHQRGSYVGGGGFMPPTFTHMHSRTYATALGQGAFLPTELCLQRPETEVHVE